MSRQQKKKEKTVQLGSIKKGKYGPFLSFSSDIKKVQLTREYEVKGEKITEVVEVPVNENGYLEAGNIRKIEDDFKFRVEQGWISDDQAEKAMEKLTSGNSPTSSFVTVKVSS